MRIEPRLGLLTALCLCMIVVASTFACAAHTEVANLGKSWVNPPASAAADRPEVVAGNTAFALDLFKATRSAKQNSVFSPYSISAALAMTYAGARGQTEQEMRTVLHFTLPQDRLHPAFNDLEHSVTSSSSDAHSGFQLSVASSLWGQKDYPFDPAFLEILVEQYGSPLRKVDLANAPEQVRGAINDWVAKETRDKIPNLLPAGSLSGDSRLVLANAIYFKATWAAPFAPEATKETIFHAPGGEVEVPMMSRDGNIPHVKTAEWEAVSLPYQGGRFSMIALLPATSLEDALGTLTPETLGEMAGSCAPTHLILGIPKWTDRSKLALAGALQTLGMHDAFTDRADFTGMTQQSTEKPIKISQVYHEAFVIVDEKGTEAAAATAVVGNGITATPPPPPPNLVFDRPFIYLIYDQTTGSILFLGQVVDPAPDSTHTPRTVANGA